MLPQAAVLLACGSLTGLAALSTLAFPMLPWAAVPLAYGSLTGLAALFMLAFPMLPWAAVPLASGSLTGLAALWKRTNGKLLMCQHNAAFRLSFSALLLAFVDIIPSISRCCKDGDFV